MHGSLVENVRVRVRSSRDVRMFSLVFTWITWRLLAARFGYLPLAWSRSQSRSSQTCGSIIEREQTWIYHSPGMAREYDVYRKVYPKDSPQCVAVTCETLPCKTERHIHICEHICECVRLRTESILLVMIVRNMNCLAGTSTSVVYCAPYVDTVVTCWPHIV